MAQDATRKTARDVHQEITDKIIAQLEAGTRPWARPWNKSETSFGALVLPRRHDGTPYRGINVFMLWITAEACGYRNPTWMTFKQAQAQGACVRKGEKGTFVCYASRFTKKERDESGREVERTIPFLKGYTVFNVEQIDGLPEGFGRLPDPVAGDEANRIERCEAFFGRVGMRRRVGTLACYYPALDVVEMPPFVSFKDPVRYYGILGHEAAHWTGAANRLKREMSTDNRSKTYAKEEMVAEMAAAFLSAHLGISSEPREDHADYIAPWLRHLAGDKKFVFQAASAAQKAVDFLVEAAGGPALPAAEEGEELAEAA